MEIRYLTRQVTLNDGLREYMDKKLEKLERYFKRITDVQVSCKRGERNTVIVEVSANAGGVLLRSQTRDSDMKAAFDTSLSHLERQVRRHKDYMVSKAQMHAVPDFELPAPVEEEVPQAKVVREKVVDPHPMSTDEALLKMDLLGHSFFLFIDSETGDVSLVYRREDGHYGKLRLVQ